MCYKAINNLMELPDCFAVSNKVYEIIMAKNDSPVPVYEYPSKALILYKYPKLAILNRDQASYERFMSIIYEDSQKMIFTNEIFRSLDSVKDLFTAVKSLAEVSVVFRSNNQQDAKLEQFIEQFVQSNVEAAEKAYQQTMDDRDEPEEDCDESELDEWVQNLRVDALQGWQCADELGNVVKVLAPARVLEPQLIALVRSLGAGIFSAAILRELMICGQADKKLLADEFYAAFLNYYVESSVKDRPVAQFLYQCAALDGNKTVKRATNFQDLVSDIQDGIQMAFMLQVAVNYIPEMMEPCMAWVQQHPDANGYVAIAKTLVRGMKAGKISGNFANNCMLWLKAQEENSRIDPALLKEL